MSRRPSIGEYLRRAYETREECPPPEIYLEAELVSLPPEERRRVEEHAERCPACGSERALARLFERGPAAEGSERRDVERIVNRLRSSRAGGDAAPRRTGRILRFPSVAELLRRPGTRLAAAAVLVAVLGIGFQVLRSGPPPLPGAGEGVRRGGAVEVLEPVGAQAELPAELQWLPVDGAAAYRVELIAVDDAVLWEGTVEAPPAALPAAVRQQLRRAVEYRWRVEALDADGHLVGSSRAVSFRVVPTPQEPPPSAD